jgi:hypothetical protein
MELDLEVMINNAEDWTSYLIDEDGHLRSNIEMDHGLTLAPQFTSLKSERAVGEADILLFILSIPVGIATDLLASALYDWLTRHKVHRIRIQRSELTILEGKEKFTHQITEIIDLD